VCAIIPVAIAVAAYAQGASGRGLSPQERRGKTIYLTGSSPSGRAISAFVGDGSSDVPGSTLPCVSCHRHDGRGNPEGGVVPSNISWSVLTKPYGLTVATDRRRPPYSAATVARAISEGIDPAGNELVAAMPRYSMSPDDLGDLVAYLKRLEEDIDPGLSQTGIRIGTILPGSGLRTGLGQALKALLAAYVEEVNRHGGIYGRTLELRLVDAGDTPAATRQKAQRFIEEEDVFALVGAFTAGADHEVAALAEDLHVPLIGPLTQWPLTGSPAYRFAFYLLPGLAEQAGALMRYATDKLHVHRPRTAVVHPESGALVSAAAAIAHQCQIVDCRSLLKFGYKPGAFPPIAAADALRKEPTDIVFFLGSGSEFVELKKQLGVVGVVFLFGALAGEQLFAAPASATDRIFLAYPTLPPDRAPEAVREFAALLEKHRLGTHHLALQMQAYSAIRVFVEGLRRAGRDLSRERLVASLEKLYEFETGLIGRVSFGPNRRVGSVGAYVIAADLEKKTLGPASEWIAARE
jgi:ABC-type branched-subunit amino acid transport system substrate-binding protein